MNLLELGKEFVSCASTEEELPRASIAPRLGIRRFLGTEACIPFVEEIESVSSH
jgi:hypothetical protein